LILRVVDRELTPNEILRIVIGVRRSTYRKQMYGEDKHCADASAPTAS